MGRYLTENEKSHEETGGCSGAYVKVISYSANFQHQIPAHQIPEKSGNASRAVRPASALVV